MLKRKFSTNYFKSYVQGDDGFIDMEFFYISFGVYYTVVVMMIVAVLYINPSILIVLHGRLHRYLLLFCGG
jgi:hypothetical protein